MMKVLLLGGNGFVGRNMRNHLKEAADFDFKAPNHSELDALDERSVFEALKGEDYDVVLNCLDCHAAVDAGYAEMRLRMYHNLANHSDLYGRMIYFGSGAEYGRQLPVVHVSEDDFARIVPEDSYGFALYQMSLHAMASKNIYNLRLFGIFGPHEDWRRRFISNLICRGLLDVPLIMHQDRMMDYLHTDDLWKMVEWVMLSDPKRHDYNATSGTALSLRGIAEEIATQLGIDSEKIYCAHEGFADEYTSSNERISIEMGGFNPMPMRESVDKMVRYYKENVSSVSYGSLLLS